MVYNERKTLYNIETVAWTRPYLVHPHTSWEVSVSWKMLTIKDTISDGSPSGNLSGLGVQNQYFGKSLGPRGA